MPDPNDPYATRIEEATATVGLERGRTLAYAEFGDPGGRPVFVFHGGVGSRGFGLLFEDAASELGVRVISPDRPGYGRSDPDPGRTLLDWPDDVVELADALEIGSFSVLGVSGGGPYAAACAAAIPDRLDRAAMVSSLGPPEGPRPLGLGLILSLSRYLPWLAGIPIRRQLERARTDPDAAVAARARGKVAAEVELHHGDAGRRLNAQTAEAGRQGHRHAVREMAMLGRPWGFDLADVAVPVGLFHGRSDRTVPVVTAEYLADLVPEASLTVSDDLGHLSVAVARDRAILGFLLDR